MKRYLNTCLACAAVLLLAACGAVTPAERIAANPAAFASLTPEQQNEVRLGRISRGMPPQGVFLAWGYPETPPFHGEKDGRKFSKWVYTQLRAVYNPTPPMWYGPYWGPRGWYGYGPYWGNDITYIPENVAYVLFENDKVTDWAARGK